MSAIRAEDLHRTAKQLFDSGKARTIDQAVEILGSLVLQIDVGPEIPSSAAAQAALLTAVNAGSRAFLCGVHVRVAENAPLNTGWAAGMAVVDAVESLGGTIMPSLASRYPTVVIGNPGLVSPGTVVMRTQWNGWSGGVLGPGTVSETMRPGIALAGVLAGALGVSEAFQHCGGSPIAGRRDVGISLWEPGIDWRVPEAAGPALEYLPSALWLLGLGHLGQANAWGLGLLPYARPQDVCVYLMDTDHIVAGNLATGLLVSKDEVGKRKSRVIAGRLEELGFLTSIVERRFDEHMQPDPITEPLLALAGFDSPVPRRHLGGERFLRVVDAGLGAGAREYLDIVLHTFPSQIDPADEFNVAPSKQEGLPERYAVEVERLMAEKGASRGEAECGLAEIAGITVAAAFVGATAAALILGDVLRALHGGAELAVVSVDLRTPEHVDTAENTTFHEPTNPGSTPAAAPVLGAW